MYNFILPLITRQLLLQGISAVQTRRLNIHTGPCVSGTVQQWVLGWWRVYIHRSPGCQEEGWDKGMCV